MTRAGIDEVWSRIVDHAGQTFHQKRGKAFTYTVGGGGIRPSTTDQLIPRSQFEKALPALPADDTVPFQHLRGPSYIWAILMDPRIRLDNW